MKFTLGFSSCPNDTFIFYALLHHKIDTLGFEFGPVMEDVESLNQMALKRELDITKMSFAAFVPLQQQYHLLDSGSALGNNCGPLVISKRKISEEEIPNCTVAIPGAHTTAHYLFNKFYPNVKAKEQMIFSEIENAVLNGDTDLGVIIHENRFTYQKKGLMKVADLGELWEQKTKMPIPLGGIFMKRTFSIDVIHKVEALIKESVLYAFAHPEEAIPYVKMHSQEMEEEIMWQHIHLYVNDYSISLREKGEEAVKKFLALSNA